MIFTVIVHFTDRTVRNGAFVTKSRHVSVLADTDTDAILAAAQITASTIHPDAMIVGTDLVL